VTSRLADARRIAAIREHRSERERRACALQLRQQTAAVDAAQLRLQDSASQSAEAERLLITNAADPQAQLWRMLSHEQHRGAVRAVVEAEHSLIAAQQQARTAQAAHDRNIQRGQLLDQRLASEAALKSRLSDEREADERQERRP
jgi:hypothetical protein